MDTMTGGARQIRIALVLYGGVSLAVYENGVARCFYDLVRSKGVFKILLDLLDASAAVDVVTGASAGGINGLMLAAALESGQDFAPLSKLWRQLGDMGKLLRKASDAENAESLLDGKYFHDELVKSFQGLCKIKEGEYKSPGEIDVFIAGTDLDGHLRRYQDGLGKDIDDKEHRVVFHLQHRPGRKSLGIAAAKENVNPDTQGKILGAISRITASFPMAFPPVRGSWLEKDVYEALETVSSIDRVKERSFVDGGVLDNKPFGPALRAIFYHMPEGIVDRRLFYVEPDPVPFVDNPVAEHKPVAVGFASLASIPGHEGIADDLEKLLEHNERVRWLSTLEREIREELAATSGDLAAPPHAYINTRIESVARSLVIDCDGAPSIKDYPKDSQSIKLLDALRLSLKKRVKDDPAALDPYDVTFHLRRSFDLLYQYYNELKANPTNSRAKDALLLIGRVIKALKIILSYMSGLRDKLMTGPDGKETPRTAGEILESFISFLRADAPWWKDIRPYLKTAVPKNLGAGSSDGFLNSDCLSALADKLRGVTIESLRTAPAIGTTILEEVAVTTRAIVSFFDKNDHRFSGFTFVDARLYPLAFASGLYELDEVEFVRISPQDAQTGLSKGKARDKVAGDELAHFSAFLRRDWRSNDILQGRFDGVCQIIMSLLDDKALERALSRTSGQSWFAPGDIKELLPKCPEECLNALHESWQELAVQYGNLPDPKVWDKKIRTAAQYFREKLIVVGQEEALQEDLETIFEDLHFQEIKFGQCRGLRGATSGGSDVSTELDAAQEARQDIQNIPAERRDEAYRDMHLGSQDITGSNGRVPNAVVGEYGTLAYLMLWGMIRRSLGERAKSFMDKAKVKLFLRTPMLFIYCLFMLFRRERVIAASLIVAITGIIIGAGGSAIYAEKYKLLSFAVLALILVMTVVVNLFSYPLRRKIIGIGLTTIVVVGVALLIIFWPDWFNALVRFFCCRLTGAH